MSLRRHQTGKNSDEELCWCATRQHEKSGIMRCELMSKSFGMVSQVFLTPDAAHIARTSETWHICEIQCEVLGTVIAVDEEDSRPRPVPCHRLIQECVCRSDHRPCAHPC